MKMILDIGPKTIVDIIKIIDISKTVLWNGPAGYFENHNFSKGTISIAKKFLITQTKLFDLNCGWWRYSVCN